jgi:hypothetical protein
LIGPIGYYDGTEYSCLKCDRICNSCDNGTTCLTCAHVRISPTCVCPLKFYDDGNNS